MWKRLSTIGLAAAVAAGLAVPAATARPLVSERPAVTTLRTGGSTGMQLLATALANAFNKSQGAIKVTVTGGGSGAGITGVNNGTFDIGDSSRNKRDTDPAGLVFTPAALEPFVIIVNPANKIKSLTEAQVKSILTGGVKNLSQVGWKQGGPIRVYGRVSTSGTFASCKTLFTGGAEYVSTAPALASNGLDRTAVANNRPGIACVTLAYLLTAHGSVKGMPINGVAPTLQNAASGRYKYTNNQFFVTKGAPSGPVKTYIDWARSRKAQCKIVIKFALPLANC
jgi:phosphate transport system substrate-binding protein